MNGGKTTGRGLSEPPEGAIVGEDVPVENDAHDLDRSLIETAMGVLRSRGEPYASMDDSKLEEKAREIMED